MSRVGKQEIRMPAGLSVQIADDHVRVKGAKGELTSPLMPGISVEQEGDILSVKCAEDTKQGRANHGLCRSLLNNAVVGVSQGFRKELEIQGVGYRAQIKGKEVEFSLGFSHPVIFPIPEGIQVAVERNVELTVSGIDKQKVGQVAAKIRGLRPPEVYKGKGVRYKGEYVQHKVGKAAAGK